MEKRHVDRRIDQMRREGTVFRTGVEVGGDLTGEELRERYDAVVLAIGATVPARPAGPRPRARRHPPGDGVPAAGQPQGAWGRASRARSSPPTRTSSIIGGGDTGADCLGTSLRQGARSVTQLEIMPQPTEDRPAGQPWPTYPMLYRVSSAHEEGGERVYSVSTQEFVGDEDGNVRALRLVEVRFEDGKLIEIEGTEREIPAQLVLFAMGFTGPEKPGLVEQLGVELDERGNVARDLSYMSRVHGVFVAGDAGRGQSLIVWAIAEGRAAAAAASTPT